ncbi:MAG: DoxX family membrane protein [Proteobacteria bacterium]|nr:DoxX family membrane protein [Pseudomonadota bacterium]MBU1389126.1 DoxX family membrane protein [Pseudomonadota bacterium]MBU1543350.1 DoxX family membrane protein [Pseudomonadota bacterium]MBU2480905.1 DoxX family membrane protein [Pseudomonadota bacterium]
MRNNYIDFLAFIIKLILGISFIYASFHKIEDPQAFARILYGYDIFPDASINILAITVPFVELVCGFSLISGWFPRSALLTINVLLSLFIVLIGFNLIRGHQFDCGCFSFDSQNQTASNIFLLIRDAFMLAGGIFLYKRTKAS